MIAAPSSASCVPQDPAATVEPSAARDLGAPPGLPSPAYRAAKRAADVVLGCAGAVALSPVMAATAAAVKMTSPGPVIFKQQRYGMGKRPFTCYKFRSMKVDTPDDVPTSVMQEDASVMTPVGAFIRRASLDELPQLVNIIKGDMSIVGPRPMILSEGDQVAERDRYGANDIRPGLTGWAQVNGRDSVTLEEKARMDGEYRREMSLAFDAEIIAKSVKVVATRAGYAARPGCEASDAPSRGRRRPSRGKVLVVSQHYWPEPFNFADMCEGLAADGYDVTVLTGLPNYPEGELYPGYEHGASRLQERNGVRVVRAPLVPRGKGPVRRVLNYYSFSAAATWKALDMEHDFDLVLCLQSSPVMMASPGLAYAQRHGVPCLLYCIDIWPECLTAGGIKPGTPVYGYFKGVSQDIYGRADKVAVTSPMFERYMREELGLSDMEALHLPQYAEDSFFEEPSGPAPEGYDPGRVNLTFAGNVGAAQSVITMVAAAAVLRDDPRFLFHVVGSGSELGSCRELAESYSLGNVVFHGRRPLEEMPSYYAASDAMVATFADSPTLGLTLPRKIQSYMAAGRPILGTLTGEARRVVEEARCGMCCDAEDLEGLAGLCLRLADMPRSARDAMGAAGREYCAERFSREGFFRKLERQIDELIGGRND